jgi:glycosyltransferase involved in cell wall biosynthesis
MATVAAPLILLSDGVPTANGAGISQTLANLLDAYPASITCVCSHREQVETLTDRLPAAMVYYPTGPWRSWSNRLGPWLNPVFLRWQMQWLMQQPLPQIDELPPAATGFVLVSTTVPHKLLMAYRLWKMGYTVVPYFMDDWMAGQTLQWRHQGSTYTLHRLAQELLAAAPCWLMISQELKTTLQKRYQLASKPCLVVHNPAPAVQLAVGNLQLAGGSGDQELAGGSGDETPCKPQTANCQLSNRQLSNRQLIYAGSIWPMHADALIAVAKAIHGLQQQGHTAYQLHLYVNPAHWAQYQQALAGAGVHFKGWKPYREVLQCLPHAWLLLCTASFEAAHQSFSRSSVQTKLTDYMSAGKPILFVGPAESASGRFVENWDCGFTLGTNHPADIAERLQAIGRMPEQYARKALHAATEAQTTFSKPVVQQKLYDFLEQHVCPAPPVPA